MKSTIQITAQYEENYGAHNWDGKGICPEHWKPKGAQMFSLEIDLDYLWYAQEQCLSVFNTMLEKQSDCYGRYTYIDHEVIFNKPIELNSDDFEKLFEIETQNAQ